MSEADSELEARWIPWLADAPMFIDSKQVADFYDAVLRPGAKPVELELTRQRLEQLQKTFGGKASVRLPAWFPWLSLEVGGEASRGKTTSDMENQKIVLKPVENASRQLVDLSLHYLANLPERLWYHDGRNWNIPQPEYIQQTPRILAFIDFPSGTQFLPLASELNDGEVKTFYDVLEQEFNASGQPGPVPYPDDVSTDQGREDRIAYWRWFREHWSANKAVKVIERVIGSSGRPRWIDYRVPIQDDSLHLHIVGRGEVDTGVFAFNLINRGWEHGLRVVGTLKSEPDVNVLAIYEK